jgi:hypothetical protein
MPHLSVVPCLVLAALLAACTQIPVEQAETQCVQRALYGGGPQSAVTFGIGTGYGGRGWGGGTGAGIAVTTTLPRQPADPATEYTACVRRKSGQPPVTAFGQRPEVQG